MPRTYGKEVIAAMEDLLQESLKTQLLVMTAIAWAWAGAVILFLPAFQPQAYVVLALAVAALVISRSLIARHRLRLAAAIYLAGLMLSVTLIAASIPGLPTLYLYILVVLAASVLRSPRTLGLVAGTSVVLQLALGSHHRLSLTGELLSPALLTLLTAVAAWLTSSHLLVALDWALTMTAQAQKSTQEARENRAEVQSVLKSLDEAYVRLERANRALIFAREAAEKAYRFKAEFVANVSHELRTPLNLIIGFAEMVATSPESYGGAPLPGAYRGDIMAIHRAARHLGNLINDVLDLAQIEAGHLPLAREATDLGEIIREATDIIAGLVSPKGLKLEVEIPADLPMLRIDRTRIRQVMLNLLTNAVRYTERGFIRVVVALEEREVRVTVADTGCGIAADRIARAFEAFSQLSEAHLQEGSGLGLAVSRKFVEMHGGTMWIQSVLGQGTTVGLTLPRPMDSGAGLMTAPEHHPRAPGSGEPVVLVLHEDSQVLTLLRRYLAGYQFVHAVTADDALDLLQAESPAAVLLGQDSAVHWPALATKAAIAARIPVISCPLPNWRHLGALRGATAYIVKPVTREKLVSALSALPQFPRTALVVDDDRNLLRLVSRLLAAAAPELKVLEASSSQEALAILRAHQPDLLLLDLLMPEMSGEDLLQEMRREEAIAGTMVIVMSGRRIEMELMPQDGEMRLMRAGGFSAGQIVQAIGCLLGVISQPVATDPASV
jgi:signal transduction histidine kinase/ActR/RegA family two-component response regulator